ncbi:M20/M25/M40 family metallo-hydrolase [Actinoallomurus iriomotensis]|uniref:Peptidase M20 n=1 Tax=Actinoallomurus iriomotensis TaxID=478107 RepID=A0A9W6VMN2_9ACTN|nr:M20/M25/M40 family metallo-hydrolase [Actinoallomurus iriomotensis]GLY72879.1 peptidase M20 [Actinoallomurus iriomotensis]
MVSQASGTPLGDAAAEDAVTICRDLLRFDTTNYGDGSGPGERLAAEYIAGVLADAGLEPEIIEPTPGRTNVVAVWPGANPDRPRLLVHGHTDVVPADAADWRYPPFSGEIADGCVWGRGAVDMKNLLAMVLAVVRERRRESRPPARDVVLAFVADEETGGHHGAGWLCQNRPELFEGCTEAISEVGGFSVTLPTGRRLYLVETAQKGIAWYRLTADGVAGHGSMLNDENSVIELAEAVARIGRHRFPQRIRPALRDFLTELAAELGEPLDLENPAPLLKALGPVERIVGGTFRDMATPTVLRAGMKTNVIPGQAHAEIDCRYLPGSEETFLSELDTLLGPHVRREELHYDIAVETDFTGPVTDAMRASLEAEDPDGRAVPYLLSAGTDAKHFSRLGIACFGFVPLRLPPDFDYPGVFHGVDERVPTESLRFGARVLDRFFDLC